MTEVQGFPAPAPAPAAPRKPADDEIDVFGLTHPGNVRTTNQDNFLMASLHRRLTVHATSVPADLLPHESERLAFLAMVADGVGGGEGGEEASRLTVRSIMEYVTRSMRCYQESDPQQDTFINELQEAAMQAHAAVAGRAKEADRRSMATTLTLWMGVWPWNYLLQVGDSRYYVFRDGALEQVTRDQTMAQELLDQGVFTRTDAFRSKWANVLSSSIGGQQTAPVVTRIPSDWANIHLLCSDGLTKHVSDERIAARLGAMTSARQTCEQLLADALEAGGSDNVTILIGRAIARKA